MLLYKKKLIFQVCLATLTEQLEVFLMVDHHEVVVEHCRSTSAKLAGESCQKKGTSPDHQETE